MKTIELERWERNPEKPNTVRYAGQRTAQEVFAELRQRLESTGYLPDEYFSLKNEWGNGRGIPKDAEMSISTDYGSSEGIYIDIYLTWHEDDKPVTKSFITGKTLGETGSDLDRMFLTASAITKAFNGDGGTYARYVRIGEGEEPGGAVMHLNPDEQRLLINSLIDSRNRLREEFNGVERLLRRITGSITEYVNEVGERPLLVSDYDRTVLAIEDGNLPVFSEWYPKVSDRLGELLVHAAGRPGAVGRKMTLLLLADAREIPKEQYLEASKRAVDIGDGERALFLFEQAELLVSDQYETYYGAVIGHAYGDKEHIAHTLLKHATPEQIEGAPPHLLYQVAMRDDSVMALELVKKGINANRYAESIIRSFKGHWTVSDLMKNGMKIDLENYSALHACIDTENIEAARMLLDRGMDFERFQQWAQEQHIHIKDAEAIEALKEHWESRALEAEPGAEQQVGQTMVGL